MGHDTNSLSRVKYRTRRTTQRAVLMLVKDVDEKRLLAKNLYVGVLERHDVGEKYVRPHCW